MPQDHLPKSGNRPGFLCTVAGCDFRMAAAVRQTSREHEFEEGLVLITLSVFAPHLLRDILHHDSP